ncbi:auxin efflux carrier [Artemisia annua]|uniref:Auxin efflux carrier n=1 Tax=Artemisia annua TaxID=35608 RepID=A0A2U1L3Z6_ARTAN|nr:auxin efflux carrier [Artemisia annua]
MSKSMGFLDLFCAASMPVLKVLIVTALGSYLALDSIDILGQSTRKQINNIVFFVFNPALVGSNLASTITYKSMISMWFMPVNILLTFIIGSALGWVLMIIAKPPRHLKGLIIGSCAAGNMGNMLLIILPAVCKEKASPFGDPDVCSEYAIAYASLSLAIGAVYLWLYVYNLVRVYSGHSQDTGRKEIGTMQEDLTRSLLPSSPSSTNIREKVKVMLYALKQNLEKFSKYINLKAVFAPSTIGAIVGFVIGTISPMRRLLIGTTAPLRVIQDSATLVGDTAIPIVTLIVGGNLLRGLQGSGISLPLVFGIVAVKYVFLPLFGILLVKGAIYLGLVQADPLYVFVLLLHFAVPPAMNTGTITQLFGVGESECSVIMLWTYGLASIALTLWSTIFMWLYGFAGLQGSGISLPLVFGIVAVKYVFLPLFGILLVKGAIYLGLVQADPLYVFVLLLHFAVPPAMNTGTITQLFGVGESECSVIMLWTYGLASIALTLWSTIFMWLVA